MNLDVAVLERMVEDLEVGFLNALPDLCMSLVRERERMAPT